MLLSCCSAASGPSSPLKNTQLPNLTTSYFAALYLNQDSIFHFWWLELTSYKISEYNKHLRDGNGAGRVRGGGRWTRGRLNFFYENERDCGAVADFGIILSFLESDYKILLLSMQF